MLDFNYAGLIFLAAFVLLLLAWVIKNTSKSGGKPFVPSYEAEGERAEKYVVSLIRPLLRENDVLLTNVAIAYDSSRTELDIVIVNTNGVFLLEVNNYSGELQGGETDYDWKKFHRSAAGKTYEKSVKNPIRQVKRQIWILSRYLHSYGYDAWIEGRVFLLNGNSPIEHPSVLHFLDELEPVIHRTGKRPLSKDSINGIVALLS